MRKLFTVAAMVGLMMSSASAADLRVKRKDTPPAPVTNPFQYPATGPYAYIGTEAGAGSANVTVPGLNSNSITTTTADVHIGAGYVWSVPNTSMFYGCQGRVGWQNFNGDTQGFSFSGPLALEQSCYFGIPAQALLAALPNIFTGITPPPFIAPAGTTIANTNWALHLTIDERDISLNFADAANKDWAFAWGVKLEQQNLLSNGLMAGVFGKIRFDSMGACIGPQVAGACAKLGTSYLGGIDFKFGI